MEPFVYFMDNEDYIDYIDYIYILATTSPTSEWLFFHYLYL